MKFQRIDFFFAISCIFLAVLAIYFEYHPEKAIFLILPTYQSLIISFSMGLAIIFLFCFLGNIIPFPTPYILVVWLVVSTFSTGSLNIPVLSAVVASFGCLLGELISYTIGRGAQRILSNEKQIHIQTLANIMKNRPTLIPLLIYVFGATPLSDDIILIPLGILKYSPRRTLFFCWLGKLTFMLMVALIPEFFSTLGMQYSFFSTFGPIYFVVIVMYLLLRVDWITHILASPLLMRIFKISQEEN